MEVILNTRLIWILKTVLVCLLGAILGITIPLSYDLLTDGVGIAGTYEIYYMSDVWEYIKSFFTL